MTQTSDDSPTPFGSLLQLPGAIAAELIGVLPKLADRTRAQVDFAATVLEKLRCGDLGSRLGTSGEADHLADVVPFERRAATAGAAIETDRVPVEVTTLPSSPRRGTPAAKKAPAKKAAAKAPAKKAAAKAPAKKAAAKKAAAKKAAAKAPAKTAAAKAPAKKAPARKTAPKKAPAKAAPAATTVTAGPVAVDALAIPGYDTLAASQVVPRLESLSAADLESVRRYEQAGRGRHTILSRIAQLQGG